MPTLYRLQPATVTVGGPDVTLRVVGAGFAPDAVIVFNGGDEPTVNVSTGEVTTIVKPSTASGPFAVPIQVRNGADVSDPLTFRFTDVAVIYQWTTINALAAALGESVAVDPVWGAACVDAANVWAPRKRVEAGYDDDPLAVPTGDIVMGTTMYAVALYRERGAVDGYPSFEEISTFAPTGGSMGQIRRLLGIGRAAVDLPPGDASVSALFRSGRRRHPSAVRR